MKNISICSACNNPIIINCNDNLIAFCKKCDSPRPTFKCNDISINDEFKLNECKENINKLSNLKCISPLKKLTHINFYQNS